MEFRSHLEPDIQEDSLTAHPPGGTLRPLDGVYTISNRGIRLSPSWMQERKERRVKKSSAGTSRPSSTYLRPLGGGLENT